MIWKCSFFIMASFLATHNEIAIASSNLSDQRVAEIPAGKTNPLFSDKGGKETKAEIAPFRLDRWPVTRAEYAQFLKENPEWKKENIPEIFADQAYLKAWKTLNRGEKKAPVVYVSWFAANAYCESKNGRLPSTLEWEYVASASETKADATDDPEFLTDVLQWYSKPDSKSYKKRVGQGKPNFYGIYDLHGLIWEWTDDFNSALVTGDSRQNGDLARNKVCGSSAIGASNRKDYAAFMRYAMRGSLNANFSQAELGFRCAY